MFRKQINEGETEDCTLIVNGVPWDALNSGKKIQAGIDCINTINKHYGYSAPIWIDNSESITKLPETDSQLIRLIVSENHKVLTVKNN
jgi:DNA repair protein SbcC/Rad50